MIFYIGKKELFISETKNIEMNGAFKIKVRLAPTFGNQAAGMVIEGPDNYLNKVLTVAILAGYSLEDGKEFDDTSGIVARRYKFLSELTKEDRLSDLADPA